MGGRGRGGVDVFCTTPFAAPCGFVLWFACDLTVMGGVSRRL